MSSQKHIWFALLATYLLFAVPYTVLFGYFFNQVVEFGSDVDLSINIIGVQSAARIGDSRYLLCVIHRGSDNDKNSGEKLSVLIDLSGDSTEYLHLDSSQDYSVLTTGSQNVKEGCPTSFKNRSVKVYVSEHFGPDFTVDKIQDIVAEAKPPVFIVEAVSPVNSRRLAFKSRLFLLHDSPVLDEQRLVEVDLIGFERSGNKAWYLVIPFAFGLDLISFPYQLLTFLMFSSS